MLVETERNRQMANQIAHRTFTASRTSDQSILPTGPEVNKFITSFIAVALFLKLWLCTAEHRTAPHCTTPPYTKHTAPQHSPRPPRATRLITFYCTLFTILTGPRVHPILVVNLFLDKRSLLPLILTVFYAQVNLARICYKRKQISLH